MGESAGHYDDDSVLTSVDGAGAASSGGSDSRAASNGETERRGADLALCGARMPSSEALWGSSGMLWLCQRARSGRREEEGEQPAASSEMVCVSTSRSSCAPEQRGARTRACQKGALPCGFERKSAAHVALKALGGGAEGAQREPGDPLELEGGKGEGCVAKAAAAGAGTSAAGPRVRPPLVDGSSPTAARR